MGAPRVVVIAGQGYVGLPLAMAVVRAGYRVVGYDVDPDRVRLLSAGQSYVRDVTGEELRAARDGGAYVPTTDLADCAGFDVALITVPTPLLEGVPDLSHVESAARTLAGLVRPGSIVVLESTTYPGTTEELLVPLLERGSGLTAGADFHVGYSPERIDPGNERWGLRETPKVVSGVNAASLEAVQRFYDSIVDRTVAVRTPREAELAKLIENTFRYVNIALINEIAISAREMGIDAWQAIEAASTKPFGFMPFLPGPGVGGHCLPIDPTYLSWQVQRRLGRSVRFVDLARDINDHMPDYVVSRLAAALSARGRSMEESRILLLGLAYKKNTGDARESPALRIAQLLLDLGAEVRAADPHVVEDLHLDRRLERVDPTAAELAAADAVVLVTDHDCFQYEQIARHGRYVMDCRQRLRPAPNVEVL